MISSSSLHDGNISLSKREQFNCVILITVGPTAFYGEAQSYLIYQPTRFVQN